MATRNVSIACLVGILLIAGSAFAEENESNSLPWKKAYLNVGYYWASLDSGLKLSSQNIGIGVEIDVEDTLGLDNDDQSFRISTGWRFTQNKRHKVEFDWFRFRREGSKTLDAAIELPDDEDGTTTIGPGKLEGMFNFDIYKVKYEYSFFLDDRVDLNLGLGLYIMPIEFGLSGRIDGVVEESLVESITAPLPVLGLGFDFAITPKWFLRQQLDLFYLEYDNFKGGIISNHFALEYLPWKYAGFGLGVDGLRVRVKAEGEDYPEIDFKGEIEFSYVGAQLYFKLFL